MDLFYCLHGGCGATTLQAKIDEKSFTLTYSDRWMARCDTIIEAEGEVDKCSDIHYHLTVKKLTRDHKEVKVEPDYLFGAYADLFLFPSPCEFTEGDQEVHMSTMTPIDLNHDDTFNGLLILKEVDNESGSWLGKKVYKVVVGPREED